jgi:Na+-transporting NADH:ubiquinone oxidoreductase subunit B
MQFLRDLQEKQSKLFEKGGKLERFYPLFEANDTFLFTPDSVTKRGSHVRDAIDLKRMMITVVAALFPCMLMAMYNTGYQANLAVENGAAAWNGWQTALYQMLGFAFDSSSMLACFVHGALYFLPIYIVTLAAGGAWEALFAIVRKHEINEGFLVTSALLPLTLPPTIPLWQVALGVSFGVVIGKEVFGGTGMNIWNPALMARAFLFFAYPAQISGEKVWIAAQTDPDGYSGATWLGTLATTTEPAASVLSSAPQWASEGASYASNWFAAFIGLVPGSMGETSALACLLGAIVLIITRVGSWRTMFGCVVGSLAMCLILNGVAKLPGVDNPLLQVPFYWHWVLGGFAFAIVFMATDPVSSAFTNRGKLFYGLGIGMLGILVRVLNPAFPEGWMLAILFMNMFAPLIDHFVVEANVRRRMVRSAA